MYEKIFDVGLIFITTTCLGILHLQTASLLGKHNLTPFLQEIFLVDNLCCAFFGMTSLCIGVSGSSRCPIALGTFMVGLSMIFLLYRSLSLIVNPSIFISRVWKHWRTDGFEEAAFQLSQHFQCYGFFKGSDSPFGEYSPIKLAPCYPAILHAISNDLKHIGHIFFIPTCLNILVFMMLLKQCFRKEPIEELKQRLSKCDTVYSIV